MYGFFAAASNPISKVIFGSVGIDFEKWNGGSKSFIMWKLHHYVGPLRLTGGSNCGKNVKYFSRPFYCQGGPSSNMGQYCNAGGEPLVTLLKQSTELRTRYWQLQVHWPQETYEKLWWWLFLFWATYQRKPIIIMTHFSSSRLENRFLRNVIHYIPTGFS